METRRTRTFFRATKRNPPDERDYNTHQDKRGDPPADLPESVRRSWDALSFFDADEGVKAQLRLTPHIGKFIARYEFPDDVGITWEETEPPGHYDVRGDREVFKQYLVDCAAYCADE